MSAWGLDSVTSGSAAVGTASSQVLAANPDRRWLRVTNLGPGTVSVAFGSLAAVAGQGVVLLPEAGGRTLEMSRGAGSLWSGQVQVVASAAGSVSYAEGG